MNVRIYAGVCLLAAAAVIAALSMTSFSQDAQDATRTEQPVIFSDDFESGNFDKWDRDGKIDPERIRIATDQESVHSGRKAVEFVAPIGKESGGKLLKWFMPGHDKIYARWYCKFAADFDQGNHMHFVHVLANRTDNKWSAFGKAGIKPRGDDFFTTGLEPWRNWKKLPPPGALQFYTYYPDMKGDSKTGKFYGNFFGPQQPLVLKRDQWYCMEVMVKLNDLDERNGEQAFWVDGKEMCHVKDLRLRTSGRLKLNCLWLLLYVHDSEKVNKVWFDDVVTSTEYIGPLNKDDRRSDQAER